MEIDEELVRDVYAQFGLAYYLSESVHRGLCFACALLTFRAPEDITRPRLEEKLVRAYSLTLGQLIEETKDLLPHEMHSRLDAALINRNYIAHHFWFERAHLMFSRHGLEELREELMELAAFFSDLDGEIDRYYKPKREAFGVTNDIVEEQAQRLRTGELEEPLLSSRPLKKQERLIRTWDVQVAANRSTLIFETDDGCLWQLCDVGLGWTRFKEPEPDWKTNNTIQAFLPASVNPRPRSASPWNFELNLNKGAVLRVRRGEGERTYRWSVEKHQPHSG